MPVPRKRLRPRKKFSQYNKRAWRRRSKTHLKENPWCVYCLAEGEHVLATNCDHVIPHNGDEHLFWFGELQSLCDTHHEARKQALEKRGYDTRIGVDGWPIDPRHPANTDQKPIPMRGQPPPRMNGVALKLIQ
jgi:5-methylcytosine-specific restriction enzyme A